MDGVESAGLQVRAIACRSASKGYRVQVGRCCCLPWHPGRRHCEILVLQQEPNVRASSPPRSGCPRARCRGLPGRGDYTQLPVPPRSRQQPYPGMGLPVLPGLSCSSSARLREAEGWASVQAGGDRGCNTGNWGKSDNVICSRVKH